MTFSVEGYKGGQLLVSRGIRNGLGIVVLKTLRSGMGKRHIG